ncbi:hypothetical protein C8F01DRAFT_1098095 [Mycena amicta]|nr:hypothetical protein C8F01DRAFT_1098095 [Mycena amicta]
MLLDFNAALPHMGSTQIAPYMRFYPVFHPRISLSCIYKVLLASYTALNIPPITPPLVQDTEYRPNPIPPYTPPTPTYPGYFNGLWMACARALAHLQHHTKRSRPIFTARAHRTLPTIQRCPSMYLTPSPAPTTAFPPVQVHENRRTVGLGTYPALPRHPHRTQWISNLHPHASPPHHQHSTSCANSVHLSETFVALHPLTA